MLTTDDRRPTTDYGSTPTQAAFETFAAADPYPGLVQMVSVLALNKLELRDMITAEMVENPVLEELEDSVPLLDDVARQDEDRERPKPEENTVTAEEKKDPFEEIDFGSFFQDYLDPGYRSRSEMEDIERPSFENFLSKPSTLSDHLAWQLGACR